MAEPDLQGQLTPLNQHIIDNTVRLPHETVHEYRMVMGTGPWGMAIADINDSQQHFHSKTLEVYVCLEGTAIVVINGKPHTLAAGHTLTIYPGQVHRAYSPFTQPARCACFSLPPWSPEDHHLCGPETHPA